MNNPFAAQPAQLSNPFAAAAPTAAPPPPAPTQGVAAIQAAFAADIQAAFAAAAPAPVANPFAPTAAPVVQAAPAVQYAPLNPPGEAGLGAQPIATTAPAADPIVEPDPPAAPKRRGRKPRVQTLDEAVQSLAAGEHVFEDEQGGLHNSAEAAAPGVAVHEYAGCGLSAFTTDQLVDALISAGYTVTITKSKDGA